MGSNGIVSFDASLANAYCPWSFSTPVPSTTLDLLSIMGPYHDIDPSVCGSIRQGIYGIAPCRTFVVSFDNICHFSCTTPFKADIKLSCTNQLESLKYMSNLNQLVLLGIVVMQLLESKMVQGTNATAAPGRNTGPWTVSTPEAWRFSPDGAPTYSFNWFDMAGNNLGTQQVLTSALMYYPTALKSYIPRAVELH